MWGTGITREYLLSITDQLAETVTNPRFLERVQAIQRARPGRDQYAAAQRITIDSLREEGLSLPEGFRIVPRTFENPEYARRNGVQPAGREPGSDNGEVDPDSYDRSSWPEENLASQPETMPSPEEIARHIKEGLHRIADFVAADAFRSLLDEMAELPPDDRPRFVLDVVLNSDELQRRGITVPEDLRIQRSTFHDGRPTLFCVSALTPLAYPWRKVTFTLDNVILDGPATA